jgi:LysM domain
MMLGGRSRVWRHLGTPAVAAALGVLQLALVRLVGPPGRQLAVLCQLGEVGADPLASLLALLALAAEGADTYLLAVLGLRLLALLPGIPGRLAAGATLLVTPAAVRRGLDLLLGGALLAQATLAPLPARAATSAPRSAAAGAAWTQPDPGRPGAPAPLPPWLAEPPRAAAVGPAVSAPGPGPAGPGAAAGRPRRARRPPAAAGDSGGRDGGVAAAHTVRPGDTLWGIAAAHLPPSARSLAAIDRYWRRVYGANRAVVGPDPDLIHPGTRLLVPPDRSDHR